jgi:hypothetical protein
MAGLYAMIPAEWQHHVAPVEPRLACEAVHQHDGRPRAQVVIGNLLPEDQRRLLRRQRADRQQQEFDRRGLERGRGKNGNESEQQNAVPESELEDTLE